MMLKSQKHLMILRVKIKSRCIVTLKKCTKNAIRKTKQFDLNKIILGRVKYEKDDWLIIVTSDHGGIGTDHGDESLQERITFAVMNAEF